MILVLPLLAGPRGTRALRSMRSSLAILSCWLTSASGYPRFDPLHVWPQPRAINFPAPSQSHGPLRIAGASVTRIVDASCGDRIETLLRRTMAPLTTSRVHDTVTNHRTWPRRAYEAIDMICPLSHRCDDDGDCSSAGATCLVDPTRGRSWNSTHLCNPHSSADALCGCCSDSIATLRDVTVQTCSDVALSTQTGPESYTLAIEPAVPAGSDSVATITIRAATPHGAAHAISVLAQLMEWDTLLADSSAEGPSAHGWLGCPWPVHIEDSPRFPWRGLLVDTSRHFLSVSTLTSILDGMAAARLNRFHWHIVDAPAFAYQSTSHPEMARDGSWTGEYRHGAHAFNPSAYSVADVTAVVAHADSLFIDVMFELDTPAHTMSWGRSVREPTSSVLQLSDSTTNNLACWVLWFHSTLK